MPIRMVVTAPKGHKHAGKRYLRGEDFEVDGQRVARLYTALGVACVVADAPPAFLELPHVARRKVAAPAPAAAPAPVETQPAAAETVAEVSETNSGEDETPAAAADTPAAEAATKPRRTYKRRDMNAEGTGS